jgi:bifunctional DNase/RNase
VPFPTVELRVVEIKTAVPAGSGIEAGLVGLQEIGNPGRILRIVIGQPEARAISASWRGQVPARPSTWDLFVSAIEALGGELRQVVITAVEEQRHFFASLEMARAGEPRVLPCRPSDGVALAMRWPGAKIMTYDEVMGAAGVFMDGSRPAGGSGAAGGAPPGHEPGVA